jgi:hypothetical protein
MPAGYQELFLEKGSTFSTTITLDDIYGVPYDLTGLEVKSQVRKSYYSANTTAEFTVTIPTPTDGSIILLLDSTTTSNISPGRYVYDVLLRDNVANTVTRVLEGIVNVNPQVTRW